MSGRDSQASSATESSSRSAWARASDWLAAPLALLAPYFIFVTYHDYGRFRSEVLAVAVVLAAVGAAAAVLMRFGGVVVKTLVLASLLTFYLDLQLDLVGYQPLVGVWIGSVLVCWLLRARIAEFVAGFGLLILCVTLLAPATARIGEPRFRAHEVDGHDPELPPVVHLILDEHIGVEGIPADIPGGRHLREDLKEFYTRHGFRLYGRAFSQYYNTSNSIPNLMNFTSDDRDGAWFEDDIVPRKLGEAAYLRMLSDRGYAIRVYQSDYVDFCSLPSTRIVSCERYRSTSIGSIEGLDLPVEQKASFVFRSFLDRSTGLDQIRLRYDPLRAAAARRGIELPVWPHDPRVGPIPAMEILNLLRRDIEAGARGTAFFAHLLHPHYPYVYDASCSLRGDTSEWLDSTSSAVVGLADNTAKSRARRYELYFEQVRCLTRELEEVFDTLLRAGVYEESTIVVHGDHGSRIVRFSPRGPAAERMSRDDYLDAFSALFAAKVPGWSPGYDPAVETLQVLLGGVVGVEPASPIRNDVFLYTRQFSPMLRRQFEAFR